MKNTIKRIFVMLFCMLFVSTFVVSAAFGVEGGDNAIGFTVSPLTENIVLAPGESYSSSIRVSNPGNSQNDVGYEVEVQPFFVDEEYNTIFRDIDNRSLMANWITIDSPSTGVISPNETNEIVFTINVPEDAPAGGQYADVRVVSANVDNNSGENSSAIGEKIAIGHLIFAEVTGNTIRQGEIISTEVPSFLLSGDIKGTTAIKNTGNVHSVATYKLQIFPLFSDEELYTNEEDPEQKTILPDRTLYNETVWDKTPSIGIFNVVYTVEFEGITTQVSKMVIKCPIWLMFVLIFALFLLIFYFVLMAKNRKKSTKN